jgi:hypothetical protein
MEVNLAYAAEEAPPLSIFATAAVVGVSLKADPNLPLGLPPTFLFPSGYVSLLHIAFSSDLKIKIWYLLDCRHICLIGLHFCYHIITIDTELCFHCYQTCSF